MDETCFDKTFKNERLKEILRSAILRGEFKPGELMLSQTRMCEVYGVSIHTVREAVASLVHEGLLTRTQGKGTFVSGKKLDKTTVAFVITRLHRDLGTHYRLGFDRFPVLVQAAEEEARANGASVVLSLDHGSAQVEREILLDLVDRRVGGAILFYIGGTANIDCLRQVRDAGVPLVLIDRYAAGVETDYVVTDNFRGAYKAVSLLIRSGFERIYHFTLESEATSIRDRHAGYQRALADHGLPYDHSLVRPVCPDGFPSLAIGADMHESERLASEAIAKDPRRFAAFGATSAILAGIWRAIERNPVDHSNLGLACFDVPMESIPDDVLLVKVVQPIEDMARRCVRIIADRLSGNHALQQIVLEPTYRIEGTDKRIEPRGVRSLDSL